MLQWYSHEMDTNNIILHRIAHFRGQVNKTEATPTPKARGQLVEAKAKILTSRPYYEPSEIAGDILSDQMSSLSYKDDI